MTSKELREQRMKLREEQKAVLTAMKDSPTDELRAKYDAMDKDFEQMTKDIERIESFETRERELAASAPAIKGTEQKSWSEEFREGILRGEFRTNAQSTTDAKGGYTIPVTTQPEVDMALKMYGKVFEIANVLRTSSGNPIEYPTTNDTTNVGYLIAEAGNLETSATDATLSYVQLDAYKYTSGLVRISRELIADSAFDFQKWLLNDVLAVRLGRALAAAATTGTGSAQPQGFVTGATYGEIWDNDAVMTRLNILDLIHSLDPAYRQSPSAYLTMHDSTLKLVRQIVDGNGMFLYQPSGIVGVADTIEGMPYMINQSMAEAGTAGNKLIVIGDFNKFLCRFAGPTELRVSTERFFDTDQIAVVALQRFDSAVLQTSAFKYLYESAT